MGDGVVEVVRSGVVAVELLLQLCIPMMASFFFGGLECGGAHVVW